MLLYNVVFALGLLACLVKCQVTTSISPLVLPLAVRSPYLNAWMVAHAINTTSPPAGPGGLWPVVAWDNTKIVGWAGIVRVDGHSYMWQGAESDLDTTDTVASYVTPTRTVFTVAAGPVQLNLTYLSPVEPSDWVRQSFPFSYLAVDVFSVDGQQHNVQLYTDVTGEWLSDNNDDQIQWATNQTSTMIVHSMHKTNPISFSESDNYTQDGTLYLTMPMTVASIITWQTAGSTASRLQFNATGSLNNTQDTSFRSIHVGTDWPVLALSADLGTISRTSSPVLFAIGMVREPAIRYLTTHGAEIRSLYFWTKYETINSAIEAFFVDFQDATQRAIALDSKIMSDASAISTEYADLVALGLRQTFSAMDITVPRTPSGQLNASDVKIFMKDLGNSARINSVETIYAVLPAFLYFNSTLVRHLLEPLLEFQASTLYNNGYAAPDLGTTYPDVKGNSTEQPTLAVEECGTMLVATLAHAQKSGDGTLLQRFYPLLKTWADYLVNNTLHPTNSLTSDGLPNSVSNLALKGIVGIYAMSTINSALESLGAPSKDTEYYKSTAQSYMLQWQNLSFSLDHITSAYGVQSSWSLLYNAYCPKLLNISLIDQTVLSDQSLFYLKKGATAPPFGLPYDSSVGQSRSDWTLFTAAALPNTSARDNLISMVHYRAFWNTSNNAWSTLYDSESGNTISGRGSPAQGAMFALLGQSIADKPIKLDPSIILGAGLPATSHTGTTNISAIAGGVIGGIALLALILGILVWYLRRKQATKVKKVATSEMEMFAVEPLRSSGNYYSLTTQTPEPDMGQVNRTSMSKAQLLRLSYRPQYAVPILHPLPTGQTIGSEPSGSKSMSSLGKPASESSSVSINQDAYALRNEFEELRRQMAALQDREIQHSQMELPPTYNA